MKEKKDMKKLKSKVREKLSLASKRRKELYTREVSKIKELKEFANRRMKKAMTRKEQVDKQRNERYRHNSMTYENKREGVWDKRDDQNYGELNGMMRKLSKICKGIFFR